MNKPNGVITFDDNLISSGIWREIEKILVNEKEPILFFTMDEDEVEGPNNGLTYRFEISGTDNVLQAFSEHKSFANILNQSSLSIYEDNPLLPVFSIEFYDSLIDDFKIKEWYHAIAYYYIEKGSDKLAYNLIQSEKVEIWKEETPFF